MEYFCFLSQMFNYKNKLNNCFINTMAQLPFATKGFEAFANFHAYCAKWADCYACLIKEELANRVRLNIEKPKYFGNISSSVAWTKHIKREQHMELWICFLNFFIAYKRIS